MIAGHLAEPSWGRQHECHLFCEGGNPRVAHRVGQRWEGSLCTCVEPRADGPGSSCVHSVMGWLWEKAPLHPFSILVSVLYTGTCGDIEINQIAPAWGDHLCMGKMAWISCKWMCPERSKVVSDGLGLLALDDCDAGSCGSTRRQTGLGRQRATVGLHPWKPDYFWGMDWAMF